ncbi:MAG: DNA mismatch repair endonuclease MutL [Ruminococcaceae bacterium]|nr:DNA mismatch repair endonuclease MutL [Oscillospiraceae bacterium]
MAEIKVLPQNIADKIAAGEVAERPSAVVKELVENSIDAGATSIQVEIEKGGVKCIRVTDNGCGIPENQVETAFLRHATSKLRNIEDLYSMSTMGFRGEALSSICAVANVRIITRTESEEEGTLMELSHGIPSPKESIACNKGTIMEVCDLFQNIPARMKFLKKDSTESGYVADVLGRIAMAKPNISFKYVCDGAEVFQTSGDGNLKNAILNIYGLEYAKGLIDVDYEKDGVRIFGVCGKSDLARGNRTRQTLFVNGRYIKNHVIAKVAEEAYRNSIMVGKFPFFVLNINLSPSLVDVNVHPAKTEIKIADEKRIYDTVYGAVSNALMGAVKDEPKMEKAIPVRENYAENASVSQIKMKIPSFSQRVREEVPAQTVEKFIEYTVPHKEENVFCEEKTEDVFDFIEEKEEEIPYKVVGQVFETYVIFQQGEKMFFIDQHAAHERFRFENLLSDYKAKKKFGQMLLIPVVMNLTTSEMDVFRENQSVIEDFGFEAEEFGKDGIIIRQSPITSSDEEIKGLMAEMIEGFSGGFKNSVWDYEEKMIDMISCKYAIKANKKLTEIEMDDIVRKTLELEKRGKATCPHGRPIKIEFSKQEVEKMFKRIV